MLKLKQPLLLTLIGSVLLGAFAACADKGPCEPSPEAARKFLKLRGYEFDEPSFFAPLPPPTRWRSTALWRQALTLTRATTMAPTCVSKTMKALPPPAGLQRMDAVTRL